MCVFSCSVMPNSFNPMVCSPQAPLSMGVSRSEYWGELPRSPTGDLPRPGFEPMSSVSPALAHGFSPLAPPGKPRIQVGQETKERQTLRSHIPAQILNLRNKISTLLRALFFSFLGKILLFLAVLGLCCCVQAFSLCREWELPFTEEHRLQAFGLQWLWPMGLVALQHVESS